MNTGIYSINNSSYGIKSKVENKNGFFLNHSSSMILYSFYSILIVITTHLYKKRIIFK